jgi:sugar lactone lactonase YvrE
MNTRSAIKIIYFAFFGIFILNACQKGAPDQSFIPDTNNSTISAPVTSSVTGLVVDENNNPIPGVTIKASNAYTSTTDSKGSFRFNNISLDRFTSVISAEATGYFNGYRVFAASKKGLNFVKIQLLKKTVAGTMNAVTGGVVSNSNYTITIPANTVVNKSTGSTYSGTVTVYAYYINPIAANMPAIVPGNMIGVDSLNKRVILQSLGMLAVELRGSAGESLQIALDKNASLKLEIPSLYVAKAPVTIPLWYVDEQTGLWKQEGMAVKTGTAYTGIVKHFSFWNCDIPSQNLVYLEMTIKNLQGQPLPHTMVEIRKDSATGWSSPSYGYTDSTGYVGGLVPANEPLLLTIKNECYSSAHTKVIGPLSQNTDLGSQNINTSTSEVNIAGTVKNCAGQAVTNGWVDIFLDNKSYRTNINTTGAFAITLLHCNNKLGAIANDISAGKSGNPKEFIIGVDDVSHLLLTACDVSLTIYRVTTLAGSDSGYVDGTGSAARFYFPEDVAVDASGNIIVADLGNNRIRKITPAGVVTTLAGGSQGYANGVGTAAKFYYPSGVAVDANGNIIVADRGNSRIRKITPAGVVTTIAGDGTFGFADGTGTAAKFSGPNGVGIDASGNIFVADYNNHRIRKISTAGVVTTIAGNGLEGYADGAAATAKFAYPATVAVDLNGNIIVGEWSGTRIRKISGAGTVSTIAGNGTSGYADGIGTSAMFAGGHSIDIDTSGNIFVADYNNFRIRKISPTFVVTTIAGNSNSGNADGIGISAQFSGPNGVATDLNGNIYISDRNNSRIRKLAPQ